MKSEDQCFWHPGRYRDSQTSRVGSCLGTGCAGCRNRRVGFSLFGLRESGLRNWCTPGQPESLVFALPIAGMGRGRRPALQTGRAG
jgi:hypothetical protein